jgi:uncharacterized protein (DUF1697 family)
MRNVALLRGINVGGKNKLPMKELAAMFTDVGCAAVQTYIQSGNVVFEAKRALARRVPALITEAIAERFGYGVPVVTRAEGEYQRVLDANPFLREGVDPKALHVAFLADRPTSQVASLDPNRSPPDKLEVIGREIYLFCPNGIARTKLTNDYFDLKLGTTSTMRNWRTVLKLGKLLGLSSA